MNKDIEWANGEIEKLRDLLNNKRYEEEVDDLTTGVLSGLKKALNILDQLDEPETLSAYWIEQKSIEAYVDTLSGEVQVTFRLNDLEKLLLPEMELTVIPKFVADWIETCKEFIDYDGSTINIFDSQHETDTNLPLINTATEKERAKVYDWIADYSEKYARAWLDGFTVEKEQKYVVKLPMSKNNDNQYAIVDYSGYIWTDALPSKYKITEEEIRGLTKGDILFEHFAVKVEEFEE